MTPLAQPSEACVRELLAHIAPELRDASLQLSAWEDPVRHSEEWARGHAVIDGAFIVKFAWSDVAAQGLPRQFRVVDALLGSPLPVPRLLAVSDSPVGALYRRIPGDVISYEWLATLDAPSIEQIARAIANVLVVMHDVSTYAALANSDVALGPPVAQATTERLRSDLTPLLDPSRQSQLAALLDHVDAVLRGAPGAAPVLLHGDFHGHNLVRDGLDIVGVLDFETVAFGDHHFDFRYLPLHEPTFGLARAVIAAYEDAAGRAVDFERVLAWSVLTDLGDALWRTEVGVDVPGGPIAARVDGMLGRYAEAGIAL